MKTQFLPHIIPKHYPALYIRKENHHSFLNNFHFFLYKICFKLFVLNFLLKPDRSD